MGTAYVVTACLVDPPPLLRGAVLLFHGLTPGGTGRNRSQKDKKRTLPVVPARPMCCSTALSAAVEDVTRRPRRGPGTALPPGPLGGSDEDRELDRGLDSADDTDRPSPAALLPVRSKLTAAAEADDIESKMRGRPTLEVGSSSLSPLSCSLLPVEASELEGDRRGDEDEAAADIISGGVGARSRPPPVPPTSLASKLSRLKAGFFLPAVLRSRASPLCLLASSVAGSTANAIALHAWSHTTTFCASSHVATQLLL